MLFFSFYSILRQNLLHAMTIKISGFRYRETEPAKEQVFSFEEFVEENGKELQQRIVELSHIYDPFLENINSRRESQGVGPISEETLFGAVYKRELAFAEHILGRFETILQATGEASIQLSTSMMSDIDETAGTRSEDIPWHIRPVFRLLLEYMKKKKSNLSVGICTSRKEKFVEKQLEDPEEEGSLVEIRDLIDEYMVYTLKDGVLHHEIREVTSPYYGAQLLEYMVPGGEYRTGNRLLIIQELLAEKGMDENTFWQHGLFQYMREVMFNQRVMRECENRSRDGMKTDRRNFRMPEEYIPEVRQELMQNMIREEARLRSLEAMSRGEIRSTGDFVDEIREELGESGVPAAVLNREIHRAMLFYGMNVFEDPSADFSVLKRAVADVLPITKPYQVSYDNNEFFQYSDSAEQVGAVLLEARRRVMENHAQNMRRSEELVLRVKEVFRLNEKYAALGYQAISALGRLASAKATLDRGISSIAVAVDNELSAQAFDDMLTGKLVDAGGEPIDGYALLGLEDYRGRIYLVHCGLQGEYQLSAIEQDVLLAA